VKLALAQINPTVGDFTGNKKKILQFARQAASEGADLVVFPELCVCGYPPADLLEKGAFVARCQQVVEEIAGELDGIAAIVGSVQSVAHAAGGKAIANVAVMVRDGKLAFTQAKMLLPYYDVFDEQRYFAAGTRQELLPFANRNVALTVCEDAWNDKSFWPRPLYEVDPVLGLLQSGGDFVMNISASPYHRGKPELRRKMLASVATAHDCVVAMVNQVGGDDSLIFDGNSFVLGPDGEVLGHARAFEEDLLLVDLPDSAKDDHAQSTAAIVLPEQDDIAADYQALVLGTRDYVRKCGFQRVIIGLSGGIDSALVAAIAVDALGAENVLGVLMPSEYSSHGSLEDAVRLARNLKIRAETLPISDVFRALEFTLAKPFRGMKPDLTEENLQSRIRGTLLMALSNKLCALVLTTGNKSEMAVGYCTLYGDMVGALAVIADVFKTDVYRLARYANRHAEVIPQATIDKPPSAELRPGQRDTDTLPDYDVLDPILEAYVERYEPPARIAETTGAPVDLVRQIVGWVEKSEYKRQQAAPVLKITRKSFGFGRRFPIAAINQV
jgi:NAD+ synthase (glutamine-hydrolysing)